MNFGVQALVIEHLFGQFDDSFSQFSIFQTFFNFKVFPPQGTKDFKIQDHFLRNISETRGGGRWNEIILCWQIFTFKNFRF